MRLIRLCWSDTARVAKHGQDASTKWFTCDPSTLKDFEALCEAGNRDHGVDSHWIEQWEMVGIDSQRKRQRATARPATQTTI
ncbi:hypothetical protein [Hydrogenophaga palleronii]|uniref:hypothetical protein n=1 Tax=Hydrogenophaga palleronii TaxID=65655 RepID=UPI000825ED1B|nr:hypothetical protein [Hydrogenophaga palleronii]